MARVLPLNSRSIREKVSAEEWATRVDLAACYRLVALYGMTDLVYNHITARVPGADEHVLINPYGMLYAVSALAEGLMPLSQTAMRFAGHVAYHEYEGPAFNRGERER